METRPESGLFQPNTPLDSPSASPPDPASPADPMAAPADSPASPAAEATAPASISSRSRFRGGIYGVAVGDALGLPVEMEPRPARQADPVTGMRGFGKHNLPPGTWSDDTSMTLCLLEGLLQGQDWNQVARLFERWSQGKQWIAGGKVFDSGQTVAEALVRLENVADAREAGLDAEGRTGNSSLMRTLPVALMLRSTLPQEIARAAHNASRITHAHPRCQMACGIYCVLARHLLDGLERAEAWEATRRWAADYYERMFPRQTHHFARMLNRTAAEIAEIDEAQIDSTSYVIDTFEAALWAFFSTCDFASCCLRAVNLGFDTDTTGAVAGGLAGVYYGFEAIPPDWISVLARRMEIEGLINRALARR